jgi:hypothetical protein
MSNLFWLTDARMARLEPFFPKSLGRPCVDERVNIVSLKRVTKTIALFIVAWCGSEKLA